MSNLLLYGDAFVSRQSATPKSRSFEPSDNQSCTASVASTDQRCRDASDFCEELKTVTGEAAVDGWDGPNTKAYDIEGLGSLHAFVNSLPADFPYPALSIDPKGRLILEWTNVGSASLACTLTKAGRVSYSLLFAGQQSYGTFDFSGDQLPSEFALAASKWWHKANPKR